MLLDEKKETRKIAEELYNYYISHSDVKIDIWLESLLTELSNSMGRDLHDIENHLEGIVKNDKNIPIDQLSDNVKMELFREIAEWLVAEGLFRMVKKYKQNISDGIENDNLIRINKIIKIIVIKELEDHQKFNNTEELKSYLLNNYLIDISSLIGSGKRMNVYDFVPRDYPLPFPKEDSLTKGIVFHYPNKSLIIRIMNDLYREFLNGKFEESEKDAIDDFTLMDPYYTFSIEFLNKPEKDDYESVKSIINSGNILKEHLTSISKSRKRFSFIPPLIIMKVILQNSDSPEYITIQQKIKKRGEINLFDSNFIEDIKDSKIFRMKLKSFIKASKNLLSAKGLMPDLIGSGNVLYNDKMNIYLVDINNVCKEPDYESLANMLLLRDIKISIMEKLNIPVIQDISVHKLGVYPKNNSTKKLFESFYSIYDQMNRKLGISIMELERIINYDYYHDKHLLEFLRAIKFLDDLNEPIFMHNIDKIFQIEKFLLSIENNISDESASGILLKDEFYHILNFSYGPWKKKNTFNLEDILSNKILGHSNWIAYNVLFFYNNFTASRLSGGL